MNSTTLPTLLTSKEVAAYLGKSLSWLEHERLENRGPRYTRVGYYIRYRESDVIAYLDSNNVETSEQAA